MADAWTFGAPVDATETLGDGTTLPHRKQVIYLNGHPVGEIEIHAHRRTGPDHVTDLSYGVTAIAYGALVEDRTTPDTW